MQPTQSDVHVNVPLSNFSLMFQQDAEGFVADKVFPGVPVEHQSNVYYAYNRGDFNRNQMKIRAAGTESVGSGYNLNANASYFAPVYALHKDIADQVRNNADAMLNPDLEATRFLTTQALINKEVNFTTTYFSASAGWTTNLGGVNTGVTAGHFLQWNDPKSTPISDIRSAKRSVALAAGGYRPNKLVLGRAVYDQLIDHPDIVERVKFAQKTSEGEAAMVAKNTLAQLFELDEVLVADAIQNTAVEGAAEVNAYIAGRGALLVYTPATPSLMSVAAGLTFNWTGMFGSSVAGTRILSYYMPWLGSQRTEIEAAYAQKMVAPDLGCFFDAAVAA